RLRAGRHVDRDGLLQVREVVAFGVERRQVEAGAQGRRRHRQRDLADQSVAVAREARVPGDLDLDVEVTGRASPGADLALAGQLDAVAVVDARGHVDLQAATRAHAALAVALAARVGDDGAVA